MGAGGRRGGRLDGGADDVTARSRRRTLGVHRDAESDVHVVPLEGCRCRQHNKRCVINIINLVFGVSSTF